MGSEIFNIFELACFRNEQLVATHSIGSSPSSSSMMFLPIGMKFFFFSFFFLRSYRVLEGDLIRYYIRRHMPLYVWLSACEYSLRKHAYNTDPLKPQFYIVKLGFTGVYISFLISAQNIDCGYSLEPPRRGGSNEYLQSMF